MKNYSDKQVEDGIQNGAIAVVIFIGAALVIMAVASYFGVPV